MSTESSSPTSLTISPDDTSALARRWTKAMWNAELWKQVSWLGVPVWQCPTDLVLMQELLSRLRPRYVIETGVALGGTAVFYVFDPPTARH